MNNTTEFTPEQSQASREQVRSIIQSSGLPIELLAQMGDWAEAVVMAPERFPEFQNWLREQGLSEARIPKELDMQKMVSMVAIGDTAVDLMLESDTPGAQPAAGAPAAPISPDQLAGIAAQGRNGDTELAHITSEEAALLKSRGGTGTINPATGLTEYGFLDDLWDDVWDGAKSIVKKVAPIALPIAAIAFPALLPAVGTYLGASAALAPIVGAAAVAGGMTAIQGGSAKDILSSAALSGLGSYLTPVIGNYVGSAVGVTSPVLTNVIGSAGFSGGLTALRGGTVGQILTDAATGGAASYLGQIASAAINGTPSGAKLTNNKITQSAFDDAAFIAADAAQLKAQGLSETEIATALRATGVNSSQAASVAKLAAQGTSAADITVKLANAAGSTKNLYVDKASGAVNSVIGGGNVEALETVQRIEDARFIAEDAKQLKAQGLSTAQIKDNLIMAGVDPKVAASASGWASRPVDSIVKDLTNSSSFKSISMFKPDFDPATVQRELGAAPGAKETFNTVTNRDGSTTTYSNTGRVVSTTPAPATATPVTDQTPVTGTPLPDIIGGPAPIEPGTGFGDDSLELFPTTPPANPAPVAPPTNSETYTYDDGSTITIDKTTGAVINSTNSDGSPYVAGSNPNLPANQPTAPKGNTTQTFDDGSTLTTDPDGNVVGATNSDGTPYDPGSNPNLPGNQIDTTPPGSYVPPYVPPAVKPVDPYAGSYVGNYSFGTVTPPDTTQGINPGMMPGARDYFGTSPVQAQFDWGKTAYQPGPEYDPALNPQLPQTPWGLQQMYTPMSPEQLLQLTQDANLYAGLLPSGRQG